MSRWVSIFKNEIVLDNTRDIEIYMVLSQTTSNKLKGKNIENSESFPSSRGTFFNVPSLHYFTLQVIWYMLSTKDMSKSK